MSIAQIFRCGGLALIFVFTVVFGGGLFAQSTPELGKNVSISSGNGHVAALRSNGTVWCWGSNSNGQLGNNTITDSLVPIQVTSLTAGVNAISCGGFHTLALTSDGHVWAWGTNANGQLGDNSTTDRHVPVQVTVSGGSALANIVAIAAGNYFSVALKSDGTVWAWGSGTFGQLGNAANTNSSFAVQTTGLTSVIAIATGYYHSIALKSDGTVWDWGYNHYGQLGNNLTADSNTPVQVSGLSSISAIAGGNRHSVALKSNGTVWTWGSNSNGQLGNGTTTDSLVPVQATGFTTAVSIAAGNTHTVAGKAGGSLWAWGYNYYGQLGNNATTDSSSPVQVSGLTGTVEIAGGNSNSFALKSDGTIWAWGYNGSGQFGNNSTGNSAVPVQASVADMGSPRSMSASGGGGHTLMQCNGTLWAWGDNISGQLGDGTNTQRVLPVQVANLTNVIGAGAGGYHSLAVKSDGTVWAWGDNTFGQIGDGTQTERDVPIQVSGLTGMEQVSAGYTHSLALKSNGTVYAWGCNSDGELGNGTTTSSSTPVQVMVNSTTGLSGIKAIATRGYHSLALKVDGTLWAWGYNGSGQLGLGGTNTTTQTYAVQVTGLSVGVIKISSGGFHSAIITADGTVWTWGDNSYGQLGDGATTSIRTSPYQVQLSSSPLGNGVMVTAGDYFTELLRADGTLVGFGENDNGELGDGTTSPVTLIPLNPIAGQQGTPEVISGASGLTAISAGGDHLLAQNSSGGLVAWGDNTFGQLGNGSTFNALSAQLVRGFTLLPLSTPMTAPITGAIAAGLSTTEGYHTLALRSDGTVWAWGENQCGQLGNSIARISPTDHPLSLVPVQVMGISNMVAVAVGDSHSVSLKNDGTVWCWGMNDKGQLGDGTTIQRSRPSQVPNLNGIVAIAATDNYTLALKNDGTVWGWGYNGSGQLGDSSSATERHVPVQATGLTGVVSISAGFAHAAAVKSDGTAWCWGANGNGQLGDGTTTGRNYPVQVVGLTGAVSISAGYNHTVALKNNGSNVTIWGWGSGSYGELGNSLYTGSVTPVQAGTLSGAVSISAGYNCTLAIVNDGSLWAWGNNGNGQYCNGNTTSSNAPVKALTGVTAVSAGYIYTETIKIDGTVWGAGYNPQGQLGNGSTTSSTSLTQALGINVRTLGLSIAGGYRYSIALRADGTVWSWGYNGNGQLGNNSTTSSSIPVQAYGLTGVIAVSAGYAHTVALKSDGTVWAWGYNGNGRLGNNSIVDSPIPVQVGGLSGLTVVAISAGYDHTVVLINDGSVRAWGYNIKGQLGNGSNTESHVPVTVTGLGGSGNPFVTAISAGYEHTVALISNGSVRTWGYNGQGQLGNGSTTDSNVPISVTGLSTGTPFVTAISAGYEDSVALISDGTVRSWGLNANGQLGNNTNTDSWTPVTVSSLGGIVAISSGYYHNTALTSVGTVWNWGANANGQLGNNTTTGSNVPIQVTSLSGVISIEGGAYHILANLSDGSIWADGSNSYGELGDGTTTQRKLPVETQGINLLHYSSISLNAGGGSFFTTPAIISLNAGVTDNVGYITQVSFYQGSTLLGTVTTAPYVYNWTNAAPGYYAVTAVAVDDAGSVANSNVLQIKVSHQGFDAVAEGGSHTLALKSDGTVWTWGSNSNGQLGNNSTVSSYVPLRVSTLLGVVAVAAGSKHSVALKSDGTVWDWGWNGNGQLGNGTTPTDSTLPVQVSALSGVTAIAAGYQHTLALKNDGTVWAWGWNSNGQLGNNSTTDSSTPVQVTGLPPIVAISAGYGYSMALTSTGSVWAWGANASGQLGNNTTIDKWVPNQVSQSTGLTSVIGIAAGRIHAVALKSDGTTWAWGDNSHGQLGNNSTTASSVPVAVSTTGGLTAATSVAAGAYNSTALKTDGTVWDWGLNGNGQLGNNSTTESHVPVKASSLTGAVAIANNGGAGTHTVAIKSDGTVWSWGLNTSGQLGNNTVTDSLVPVSTCGLTGVLQVSAGNSHTLILQSDGTVWSWGRNNYGQLGNNSQTDSNVPVQVSGLSSVVAVAAGVYHSIALKNDGTVWAWGYNGYGQLGNNSTSDSTVPVQVGGGTVSGNFLHGAIAIAAGYRHSIALKSDGTVWDWGSNSNGQLGNNTTTDSLFPIQVNTITGLVSLAAGNYHSAALKSNGTVWTWGYNHFGQLGNSSTTDSSVPVQVSQASGLTNVTAIASGAYHFAAIKNDGTIWTWGYNAYGQLGNNTTSNSTVPVQVGSGLSGAVVTGISAGMDHTVALTNTGTFWTWGYNSNGQLGNNSITNSSVPVNISSLSGLIDVAAGGYHTVVLKTDGSVWAMGYNSNGQLGNGTSTQSLTPVETIGIVPLPDTNGIAPVMTFTDPNPSGMTIY